MVCSKIWIPGKYNGDGSNINKYEKMIGGEGIKVAVNKKGPLCRSAAGLFTIVPVKTYMLPP